MASEGPLSPGTCANDATIGTIDWTDVNNVKTQNSSYSSNSAGGYVRQLYLVVGGSIVGDNKADNQQLNVGGDVNKTFGGASDLWGLTPSDSDINASDFGFVIATNFASDGSGGQSKYLKCTNFGFAIPGGATIDGVEVIIYGQNSGTIYIDHVKMTVHYTAGGGGGGGTNLHLLQNQSALWLPSWHAQRLC